MCAAQNLLTSSGLSLDGFDGVAPPVNFLDTRSEFYLAPFLSDESGHRLPHHARPESRVVELFNEGLDCRAFIVVRATAEDVFQDDRERQPLDALRGPIGGYLS